MKGFNYNYPTQRPFSVSLIILFYFGCFLSLSVQVFVGNRDTNSQITVHISPPIVAQVLRIIPVVQIQTPVCMRIELYGCKWLGKSKTI